MEKYDSSSLFRNPIIGVICIKITNKAKIPLNDVKLSWSLNLYLELKWADNILRPDLECLQGHAGHARLQ